MIEILAGLLVTMCMLFGVRLRYYPFAAVLSSGQKQALRIAHIILAVIGFAFMSGLMLFYHHWDAVDIMRFVGLGFSISSALIQLLVVRKWWREQLFVIAIVLACNYIIMAVPVFVGGYIPEAWGIGQFFTVIGTYFLVLLATHVPMCSMLRNTVAPFLNLNAGNYWYTLWFIPLAIFGTRFLATGSLELINDVPHLLENILSFVIILLMCRSVANDHKTMEEKHHMDQQLAQQQMHYTELLVRLEDARRQKHDFIHHIAAIRHYIEADDKAGLDSYCDDFLASLDAQEQIPYSGNPAADGVLYHYMRQAAQADVSFRHSGVIRSPGIKDMDLCVLLGNALDNALAGCMTIESDRNIHLITQSEPQLLSIAVHNSFDGKISQTDKGLLSRKRGGSTPGLGMASMRSICQRYGGSMDVRWDDKSFTVVFILPLSET